MKESEKLKQMSLDQSSRCTGYACFNDGELYEVGTLEVKDKKLTPLERVRDMTNLIEELVIEHEPNFVQIEQCQDQSNLKVFQILSILQGFIYSMLFKKNIAFDTVEPTRWRSFLGIPKGDRKSVKCAATQKAFELYGQLFGEDESEALLIGYYMLNRWEDEKQ